MNRSEAGAEPGAGAESDNTGSPGPVSGRQLPSASVDPDSRQRIRVAQVTLFYEVPTRILGHVVNATLVTAILWGHVPAAYLLAWLGLIALVSTLRYADAWRFRHKGPGERDIGSWAFWGSAGSSVHALLWGVASSIIWLTPEIIYHVFVGFTIGGMTAAAAVTTYPLLTATRLYLLLSLVPFVVNMFLAGGSLYIAMGAMGILFVFLMHRQAIAANAMMMRSLYLQEENSALVTELSAARDNLEARVHRRTAELDMANENLRKEMAARVETEGRLQQAQKMEAIGQLTGGIAHDFNNLLAVIHGNAELLSERLGDTAAGKPEIEAVLRASERGARLTQRLLAFSRRQTLQPTAVDVNELMASMARMLGRTLGLGTEVEFRPEAGIDPASIDPGQLENVILNLAINARDAMGGGGRVVITTSSVVLSTDSDIHAAGTSPQPIVPGRYVVISVIDTGVGIPKYDLDKVWEPFFTTKPSGEGTGLGLSMVYGFVQQSGGRVTIESEPGTGTTVKLFLPCVPQGGETFEEMKFVGGHPHGDETVLVIEDDLEVQSMVERYLRRLGYTVHCAAGAERALQILSEAGKPDIIVSDVVLGGGHRGPMVVEIARRRFGPIKAIFMSGYAAGGDSAEQWTGKGAVLLDKPFELSDLARKIREVLDAPGHESEDGEEASP